MVHRGPALLTLILAACALSLTVDAMMRATTWPVTIYGNPGVALLLYPSLIGATVWLVRASREQTSQSWAKGALVLAILLAVFLFAQWLRVLYGAISLPHYDTIPRAWVDETNGDIFQIRLGAALISSALMACVLIASAKRR